MKCIFCCNNIHDFGMIHYVSNFEIYQDHKQHAELEALGRANHPKAIGSRILYRILFLSVSEFEQKTKQVCIIFLAFGEHKLLPRLDCDPDHHQKLIAYSFYNPRPAHEISLQSPCNYLSNADGRQIDQQKYWQNKTS